MKAKPEYVEGPEATARFDTLVRRVLSVSSEEIKRREAEYARRVALKPIKAGPGPIYLQVQDEVKRAAGFTVKPSWIADIKEQLGLSAHRTEKSTPRKSPCPPDKRDAIIAAMRRLQVI